MTGPSYVIRYCHVPNTGYAAYNRFYPGVSIAAISLALKGQEVQRLADNSPYFIMEYEHVRYVFIVGRGRKNPETGSFVLVNVEKRYK